MTQQQFPFSSITVCLPGCFQEQLWDSASNEYRFIDSSADYFNVEQSDQIIYKPKVTSSSNSPKPSDCLS